ncbi:hypothetical protein GQF61_02275 [Sphingobacterium sp. DK4209]|uniref:Uncharacterized protein n=2 Tax=Sphingobacterium zhuxiongii TaxID=2662364 RepID=A0A5Q0QH09_9SPHI|nr:hypothetical protein [Sphingobacterium sp. dk4302]MVZ64664.1 hypothetical protein [Sphingobacterium sp. DK4209]QGA27002.1 hypothetical protein GFH32_12030 [Sphingobacterium sp. dk4302]
MAYIYTLTINETSRMFYFFISLLLSSSLLSSCAKDKAVVSGEPGKLVISVAGIMAQDDPNSSTFASGAASARGIALNAIDNKNVESVEVSDFTLDIVSSVKDLSEETSIITPSVIKSRTVSSSNGLRAAVTQMQTGTKYRIILVNTSNNKIESSEIATAGTLLEIDVYKGQDYKWFAYSYNTEDVIPAPDLANPTIVSKTNLPLLYASGIVNASTVGTTPISINFKHQLAQLQVEVDTRGLFGGIESLAAEFSGDCIMTGNFNILTGEFDQQMTVENVGNLKFEKLDSTSNRIQIAKCYTSAINLTSYKVQFTDLSIRLINDDVEVLTTKFPSAGLVEFGAFAGSSKGKILKGMLEMWKVFPLKTVLHVEGNSHFSYAASNPLRASGGFLQNPSNFGPKSNYLRIEGFQSETILAATNALKNRLANPANYPDIIIAGMFTGFATDDYNALAEYIRRGGVVFLMIENTNVYVDNFMKSIFGNTVSTANYDSGGAIYTMTNEDADVLNWRFGDVRGKTWGQDFSATLYVKDIPPGQVIEYSNTSRNYAPQTGMSMFRHKTKHLFFVGDTGFLSSELRNGQYPGYLLEPFATTTDGSDFPVPHTAYGNAAAFGSMDYPKAAATYQAYNSVIFGNIFALLVATSHYNGIDKS